MAAKTDHWIRIFQVSQTKRHPKGYTIYEVKSTVFPRSSPEASTSVVVWRRYSELRRLHKSMSELHLKLGLPGQLPAFPRATVLNRFEADVVETRRQATLNLLNFIGKHNLLFTSETFTKFFQNEESGGKRLREKKTRKGSKGRFKEAEYLATTLGIQESSSLYSQLSDTEDDFSMCSSLDSPPVYGPETPPVVPAAFENSTGSRSQSGTLGSDFTRESDEQSVDAIKSSVDEHCSNQNGFNGGLDAVDSGLPIYGSHEYFISSNMGYSEKKESDEDCIWNVDSENMVTESVFKFPTRNSRVSNEKESESTGERHPSASSLSSVSSQSCCVYENPVHDSPKQHSSSYLSGTAEEVVENVGVSGASERAPPPHPMPPLDVSRRISNASNASRKISVPLTPLTPLSHTVTPVISCKKPPSPQEVASTQYIFVAAQQISQAQQHEQQKDYKQALNMYREGVGTLLQGVQVDGDGSRREAVRRKTAQYLQRAEQLVAKLTRKDKKKDQGDGPPPEVNVGEGGLKCRACDLQRYRVAGTAGSVIIATDTTNGDTVAIKVLIKSGCGSGEKTIVPENLPFMVPIIRYHETDSAIYLVLKFISGGKLWSHISKYVSEAHPSTEEILNTSSSTYAGRRLLMEHSESDGPVIEAISFCDTPSQASQISPHVSIQESCIQLAPSICNNLLAVPDSRSFGDSSGCSDASSSCLPDNYLQIFSDYIPSLPSSSSMMVLPHPGQTTNIATDMVPKSVSAGALVIDSGCTVDAGLLSKEYFQDARLSAVEDGNFLKDDICTNDRDNLSIGSDTLSGVSEDFSCSMPANIPDILPDPLPLPEVKVTADSIDDLNLVPSFSSTREETQFCNVDCDTDSLVQEKVLDVSVYENNLSSCTGREDLMNRFISGESEKDSNGAACGSVPVKDEGKEIDAKGIDTLNVESHLGLDDDRDDISVTDTSFASVTLPSFSWTKVDDSEIASLDIEDLIRNSKKLLQNVDHTLQQSKSHSIVNLNDSDESTSVENSELPYDSVSTKLDNQEKGNTKECETNRVHNNKGASVAAAPQKSSQINLGAKILKSEENVKLVEINDVVQSTNLSAVDRDGFATDVADCRQNNNSDSQRYQGQPESDCRENDSVPKSNNSSELKENAITVVCEDPPESSLASLLEKYSASRGEDARPKLPEGIVKVWLSQVVSAISALHHSGIIWGDFNPDNVLLDEGGSIVVTYESRWSSVQHGVRSRTSHMEQFELCVTEMCQTRHRGYLAPELESPLAYPTAAADWWSLGALMYHMLTGQSVATAHPSGINSHTDLLIPANLSPEAGSLLSQLLCAHPTERLGGGAVGAQEIKDHAFFTGIEWGE